ncbi:MAG: hypothetical protein JWR36_983 [Glaciihabitans sp.]|jgi:hypothetical protein|nr:hypothetical protein [Glaciihabitans sp.]MDQ1571553.1 hypothetical protein [Actinomycetota bacterium]
MSDSTPVLRIEAQPGSVNVFRAGTADPILVQNAEPDKRPYIHPIISPGGSGAVTENAPSHHLWQHGLYIGLNDVNGVGFWMEGLRESAAASDGTFHPRILGTPTAEGNRANWAIGTEYRDPQGEPMLEETQDWTLTDLGESYELDLVWTLRAITPLTFGQYEYGGLFLRMPFRKESGGIAINSEGQKGDDTEGQRARWVASQMPIADSPTDVLVAVMDHPANLEHPVPWRVDHELGIGPSACIAGPWQLDTGEERQFRHRVAVFAAPVESSAIEQAWISFSKEETV